MGTCGMPTGGWWRNITTRLLLVSTHTRWPSSLPLTGHRRSSRRGCWGTSPPLSWGPWSQSTSSQLREGTPAMWTTGKLGRLLESRTRDSVAAAGLSLPPVQWRACGRRHGSLISMSEQQMVDCGPGSCNGGYMDSAWNTVRNGIESEQTYPYTARDGSCKANSNNFIATNQGSQRVSHNESSLESALYTVDYPISVAIHVGSSFQHYNGGVYSDPNCQYGQLNHGVLAVGYDKSGSGYWMVKNSWGGSWGSGGYIKMKMGENSCGITNDPMYCI